MAHAAAVYYASPFDNSAIMVIDGNGSDLEIETDIEPGFVSIKYENISLGCGHWNGMMLKNQIPKSKFCKINFL